ncbi:hypothetical protein K2173_008182 [Erythroxylum novogranatense]|uniref:RING-type domain-containing protein n=1 Tax=Erythroxylum novogranatense TaxID=1862640 RepID=A0AAV8UBI1_9ROSI|nr:hypothetical protein K2173_008182 [Erythroxylum novogranatense]
MESSGGVGSSSSNSRRDGILSASNILRAPISTLLEYSGLLRTNHDNNRSLHQDMDSLITNAGGGDGGAGRVSPVIHNHNHSHRLDDSSSAASTTTTTTNGEVAIRIIGSGERDHRRDPSTAGMVVESPTATQQPLPSDIQGDSSSVRSSSNNYSSGDDATSQLRSSSNADGETTDGSEPNARDSSYQRYDIQQAARWIEQVLPFSLLLLVVFIRQHLQGFFVTIWIAVVMFKSNDVLRKQTALKGERKISVLVSICLAFVIHVVGVYWWYQNDDLLYPLIMLPPKSIPPFWHAIFIILVNDTLVRQAAMVFKCFLLMYYKNSRGRNYRKQGQMLTLVEYLMLLYRALLPTPVWYRFFLNKEYGSLFSSLMTGLYLTFKLTSVVEKVQSFFTALKALSRKEVHYGAYATSDQVNAAGDLCAICQEKMHAPILLRCKHIFCEDCVSEWFERERTCPLCRALVKPADLRSFGDGSTSLFFQIF